jgi:hypothetical protein
VRTRNDNLKLDVTSKPDGFEYNLVDKDGGIDFSFPYLKRGEAVAVKAQADNKYYFSESLGISVSSPNEIKDRNISDAKRSSFPLLRTILSTLTIGAAIVAWFMLGRVLEVVAHPPAPEVPSKGERANFEMDQRDVIIAAAADADLPHIAELYLNVQQPTYFDEGGIAFSLAAASKKSGEIEKYRRLLSVTLETEPKMSPESAANLYYSLGRLDILLSDEKGALKDFRSAITKSRTIVELQTKGDAATHQYLVERGLL